MQITHTMIQRWNHSHVYKLQVNYYHFQYYYLYSINRILCYYTPISSLHYFAAMKPLTKESIIDLNKSEEETEEEREFTTTWGE